MSKFIDISWPISAAMTSYKDAKPITVTTHKEVAIDGVTDSSLSCNLHVGTHIDAPIHFIPGGATVEQLSLEQMNGACRVLDLTHVSEAVTAADLKRYQVEQGERILLKTRNSLLDADAPFDYDFVYLAADGAQHLAECGSALVGIDALGIERRQPDHRTHTFLFQANSIILEGLRLAHVAAGRYTLILLPLALRGLEAAPARALLTKY